MIAVRFDFLCDTGELSFCRGSEYPCSGYTGVNEGTVDRQRVTYLDTDGAEFQDDLYQERTVTVDGFFAGRNQKELETLRERLVRVCNGKNRGRLVFYCKNKKYITEAIAELPEFGERVGMVQPFSCSFLAYRFYWKAFEETKREVVSFIDHITPTFSFPLVFTTKKNEADIYNGGDIPADVTLEITCAETAGTTGVLTITNETGGKSLTLNHNMEAGETIIIRSESCEVSGGLMSSLDPSSEFFKLERGNNHIKVTNTNAACVFSCVCRHRDTYVGV